MEEQNNPKPQIPAWVWVLAIFGLLLLVQLWTRGSFDGPDQISIQEAVSLIKDSGEVKTITITGDRIDLTKSDDTIVTTYKPASDSLTEFFAFYGISPEILSQSEVVVRDQTTRDTIISILFTLGPILLLIWIFSRGFRQMQGGGGNGIFGFGRSRAKNLTDANRPTVSFEDVAGVDEAKLELAEVVQFLREPERFVQVGARIPKGVLMVGPPGTGKTLLARAVAGEAGVPFFHISGSEFVEMFVGVGASRVRDLFDKAKQSAPAIVFVDEIDAVGRQRGAGYGGGHDEREQTLNQILVEMDGFDNQTNVIVMAATNRADVLDPALLRPGRFDRKVYVDLPDVRGREAILRVHARGKPIAKEVSFPDVARLTAGFAGADLENLINEAAIFAARRGLKTIALPEFQDAFDRIAIGPEKKSRVMSPEDKEMVAYHEAGHAVVSFHLLHTDPVQKITIVPRGRAGGYVLSLPEDRFVYTREFIMDSITWGLGGRAAEEIFFGMVTTGASSDLEQSTRRARAMIMKYGMTEALGLPIYGDSSDNPFLGREINFGSGRDYSDDSAKAIDLEVRRILDECYQRATSIIRENREKVVALSKALIEVETLDRDTFEKLMNETTNNTINNEVVAEESLVPVSVPA